MGRSSLRETFVQLHEKLQLERVQVRVQDVNHTERPIVLGEYELLMAEARWISEISETEGIAKLHGRLVQFMGGNWQDLAEQRSSLQR